jgi:hypothetical protein
MCYRSNLAEQNRGRVLLSLKGGTKALHKAVNILI